MAKRRGKKRWIQVGDQVVYNGKPRTVEKLGDIGGHKVCWLSGLKNCVEFKDLKLAEGER
jgi:hypothetical protein